MSRDRVIFKPSKCQGANEEGKREDRSTTVDEIGGRLAEDKNLSDDRLRELSAPD